MTATEALKLIQNELAKKNTDEVPPGWRTPQQFADEAGVDLRTVQRSLLKAMRAGIVERKEFNVPNILGQVRKSPFFRMKE